MLTSFTVERFKSYKQEAMLRLLQRETRSLISSVGWVFALSLVLAVAFDIEMVARCEIASVPVDVSPSSRSSESAAGNVSAATAVERSSRKPGAATSQPDGTSTVRSSSKCDGPSPNAGSQRASGISAT